MSDDEREVEVRMKESKYPNWILELNSSKTTSCSRDLQYTGNIPRICIYEFLIQKVLNVLSNQFS
jgi:hypothetical protein